MLSSSAGVVYHVQRPGPTPWAQVEEVWDRTIRTFGALLHSKETGVGAKDLSGPVGIFAMLAAQVSIDYRLALHFMVLLNISLAMINLLPLPVLDGGHIAMSLLEWVRRRPLNVKFVEYATTVFAVVLISFMLYVTFFDLKRFPLWKSLFGREMQIEEPAHGSGTTSNSTSPAR
jgi:regulator of sigma E protease